MQFLILMLLCMIIRYYIRGNSHRDLERSVDYFIFFFHLALEMLYSSQKMSVV